MARDGGLVAAGDRPGQRRVAALGPVRGGAKDERREQLAAVRRRRRPRAAPPPTPRARRGSWRRSRRRRGRRRVGSSGTSNGPHAEGARRARARGRAPRPSDPEIAAGAPVRSVAPSGTVCSGCSEKRRRRPRCAAAPARRAADAPLVWPANRRREPAAASAAAASAIAVSGTQSSTASASRGRSRASSRPASVHSIPARSAAAASELPTRPAPTITSAGVAASVRCALALGVGKSRSSSRIGDTRRCGVCGWCWSAARRRVRALIGSRQRKMIATPGALGCGRGLPSADADLRVPMRRMRRAVRGAGRRRHGLARLSAVRHRGRGARLLGPGGAVRTGRRPLARRAPQEQRNAELRERTEGRLQGAAAAASARGAGSRERRRRAPPRAAGRALPRGLRVHPLPAARGPDQGGLRRRQRRRRPDVHRRGARGRGGPPGAAVRRPGRAAAQPAARRDRDEARGRLHRQHPEVPPAGQPRPAAGRDRGVLAVPASARSA